METKIKRKIKLTRQNYKVQGGPAKTWKAAKETKPWIKDKTWKKKTQ